MSSEIKIYEPIDSSNSSKITFDVNKQWSISSQLFNLTASNYTFNQAVYHRNIVLPIGTTINNEPTNWDNTYQKVVYYSLEHLFNSGLYQYVGDLNEYVNVFSLSKNAYGKKIKAGSVSILYTDINGINRTLLDTGNYELIDTTISTTNFVSSSNLISYYGFNQEFKSGSVVYDNGYLKNHGSYLNVVYTNGITDSYGNSYGHGATFNGVNSYVKVLNNSQLNFTKDTDFSISFWTNISTGSLTNNNLTLISKNREGDVTTYNSLNQLITSTISYNSQSYPYYIYYNTSQSILYCKRSDSTFSPTVSCSIFITGSSTGFNHIVFQKTGSQLQLYRNNTLVCSTLDTTISNTHNNSDIYIGSEGVSRNVFSGSIDELRFYNRGLTSNQITSLYNINTAFQTNVVGNVLYEQGMIIYNPLTKAAYTSLTGSSYTLNYKSTITMTEYSFICNVNSDQYNYTLNPTMYTQSGSINTRISGSVHPYISTIGLYNKNYELVAVAKLSNPVPKLDTLDLNFNIKFDIWK